VWDYAATTGPLNAVTLTLPFGLRAHDPLPLGAIVRNGPANDYGVVSVAPSTGKIAFWENIDSAEARSLYPQRGQSVEGSVKLYSGETIVDLVDIDHAGYVLVFSSGRLAHLTLRDAQGRPSITTSFFHAPSANNGGFFSFKGLLGGAIRKTIAAVKARASESKGQMEVISVTRNATFQLWDLSWSGQQNFIREVDVQATIGSTVQADVSPEMRSQQEVQVLDFAILEQEHPQDILNLLLLVASSGRESIGYSLLEMELSDTGGIVRRAIPVRNFHQPLVPSEPTGTLLLPQPGHTAYVHFPGAVFLTSLAQPEESPDNQILMDSGRIPLPYQDTIYFREDLPIVVSGHGSELTNRKDKRATALIFVQQVGLFQITAHPPATDTTDPDRQKVTAHSKLEQATFYGAIRTTILDFKIKSRFSFTESDTEQAALDISAAILRSSHDTLEQVTSSLDDQFRKRAFALRMLIARLRSEYPPLSFQTTWQLLWNAEKLAAAHSLWNWYQDKLQDQQKHPEAYPAAVVMVDIVKALNERYKTPVRPEFGETDPIRQFFIKDVDNIGILMPWGWFFLRTFYMKDKTKEQSAVMQRISEGCDVISVPLEAAFDFRQTNIDEYGLDPLSLEDAIMRPGRGFDILPSAWTSSHNIVSSVRSLIDVARTMAVATYEEGFQEAAAQKIGKDNPRLVKLGCQTHIERFRWAMQQSDEQTKEMGRSLKREWDTNVRPQHILGLMEMGLATEGMKLAEQYRDMPTLVDLIWEETKWLENEKKHTRSKMEQAESTVKLNRIKERIGRYFETYGDDWANAFYSKYINMNHTAHLFAQEYLNQPALTKFMRADPSRARLRWISEVNGENDYDAAAASLYDAATKQETNAWCQRVELSIAKLAMLCKDQATSDGVPQPPPAQPREKTRAETRRGNRLSNISNRLLYTRVQDEVYERLLPIITGALDSDSAVELLMAEFGQGHLKDRPAHQTVLKQGFENLVHHKVVDPTLMIDILTLMNIDDDDENLSQVQADQFATALRALLVSGDLNRSSRASLLRLIWKRLLLKDDWAKINQTKNISDARLTDILVNTTIGWTIQCIGPFLSKFPPCPVHWFVTNIFADEKTVRDLWWPGPVSELLGAGATHGELCVRFSSEDLREPIIRDNVLDDTVLREHIEKNRLEEWFKQVCQAGSKVYLAKFREQAYAGNPQDVQAQSTIETPDAEGMEEYEEDDLVQPEAQDAEMQDS
jgi:nuclear pore complex protein Nup133